MKTADCPFGAAARLRAQMSPPPPMLPGHVQRVLKLLATGAGFVCGCRLGIAWTSDDASHVNAIVAIAGKFVPLVAASLVLCRRPSRGRDYRSDDGRT